MIELVCTECSWNTELRGWETHYFYCPECGERTQNKTEPQEIAPEDSLSGTV